MSNLLDNYKRQITNPLLNMLPSELVSQRPTWLRLLESSLTILEHLSTSLNEGWFTDPITQTIIHNDLTGHGVPIELLLL